MYPDRKGKVLFMKSIILKKILKTIAIIILILLVVISIPLMKGFMLYQESIKNTGINEIVHDIQANGDYINIDNLPPYYLNAVIAVEDHRFFDHGAIDIISIGRAVVSNIKEMKIMEGGSTITQQLAKNLFLTQDQFLIRKIAEAFVAFDMEIKYSKNDILELYVNTIYFGSGYYGVRNASLGYFDKEPSDLTLNEAAMLAGIPNAPSIYGLDYNPDLSEQRQKQVLNSMIEHGYLSKNDLL